MKHIIIFDFNRTLFNPDSGKLFDGALELLEDLKKAGHFLFLIGKGTKERENLIYDLHLDPFFDKIVLKEEKELADFEAIKKLALKGQKIFSVGDRIKREIVLSNRCGLQTVWIKNGKFADEIPENDDEKPWKTVGSMAEVREILMGD